MRREQELAYAAFLQQKHQESRVEDSQLVGSVELPQVQVRLWLEILPGLWHFHPTP